MRRIAGALAFAALALGGCGGAPDGGLAPSVSEEDRAFGAEQHPRLLAEFGGAYGGDEAPYVTSVGERVAAATGLGGRCTFTLVNSDVVNAFAVPGCFIYVTRGLVAVVGSEAELAAVLGHEVGHVVAAHSRRQQARSLWRTLGVVAVSLTGSEVLTRLAGQAAQFFTLRYSRGQEYEADDLGIAYLRRAGYDPYAAAGMLGALGRHEAFMRATGGHDGARSIPEWARSHPLTESRIRRAREAARATGLADDALPEAPGPYLAVVDGMLYGDDPAQGFVIGRRFAHPVMRIAFEAPEGFTLTNSPQAVGISGPGGLRGEFGGAPLGPDGLEGHARRLAASVAGDAPVELVDGAARRVNGVPAVIVDARLATREGSVPLSIAVYADGAGGAFHFIAVGPADGAAAQAVAALFASFRRLSAGEAAALRGRVIRTVAVRPGQSVATLAGEMADPHPRDLFLLLNGRAADAPLAAGERVKLVRYVD